MDLKIKINPIKLFLMKFFLILNFLLFSINAQEKKNSKTLNFQVYYDENSIDMPFSSIHFCYWEYFNNEILNTDSITKIIYLDYPIKYQNQTTSMMDDFLNKENKNLTRLDLINNCKNTKFCAYFEVIKINIDINIILN
jgi:hypothetical protein